MLKVITYCIIFVFCMGTINAQSKIELAINIVDSTVSKLPKKYQIKPEYRDSIEIREALIALIRKLHNNGYVSASVDKIDKIGNKWSAQFFLGYQYKLAELKINEADKQWVEEVGYKNKSVVDELFNYNQTEKLIYKLLTHFENNGYPFAHLWLDSFKVTGNEFRAKLMIEKNQLVRFDTLNIIGDIKTHKNYLYNYLNIRPGKAYSEQVINNISKRIEDLVFLDQEKQLQVFFTGDKAKVTLYLIDRKSSQFDFLIGFLPNNNVTGKLLVTGEANLNLNGSLGRGEIIQLRWQKLQARTQNLDVHLQYPYLLNIPFGIDFEFELYKRDTLFLNVNYKFGLQYLITGPNYVELFLENRLTNVLNVDTNQIKTTRTLPINNDVRNTFVGLKYHSEKLDYRINPRKGYQLEISAAGGIKKIKKNSQITNLKDPENPDYTFESLYDSIETRSLQFRINAHFDKYWPIAKRSVVKTAINGSTIISNNIFINEMDRIGGINLLRGFDEESIFTSFNTVITLEYRFLLSKNSYFNLFFDAAYVEDQSGGIFVSDFPYGFGAGLSFETKAGLFALSYALGSQQNNPIEFKSAKIHFGYINYF